MLHQEFQPSAQLSDTIKCFWYNKRESGEQQTSFAVLPDGYAEIIFYFGELNNIADNGELKQLPSPFMMGLLDQPVLFYTKGCLQIIGVRFFPWTVFDLLGMPSVKGSVHIIEHPMLRLQSSLSKCIQEDKIDEAIGVMQQYFADVHSRIATGSMLFKAGVAMRKANGTLPVRAVAAAAHATVRTLERNFKQSSGHTVKDVSALMRFEQVRNHLWLHPDAGIAGLALEFGYTDQSHLSKEFKRYSGTTPGAFARKSRKAKQTASSGVITFT